MEKLILEGEKKIRKQKRAAKFKLKSSRIFGKILHPEYRELDCSTEQKANISRKGALS